MRSVTLFPSPSMPSLPTLFSPMQVTNSISFWFTFLMFIFAKISRQAFVHVYFLISLSFFLFTYISWKSSNITLCQFKDIVLVLLHLYHIPWNNTPQFGHRLYYFAIANNLTLNNFGLCIILEVYLTGKFLEVRLVEQRVNHMWSCQVGLISLCSSCILLHDHQLCWSSSNTAKRWHPCINFPSLSLPFCIVKLHLWFVGEKKERLALIVIFLLFFFPID